MIKVTLKEVSLLITRQTPMENDSMMLQRRGLH